MRVSRFRQKLLWEDGSKTILDDEVFTAPERVFLILQQFWPLDAEQDQAMFLACRENDALKLEKLLESPRDPTVRDEEGKTTLHHAAGSGHLKPAELLLEAGAKSCSRGSPNKPTDAADDL
eukprot:Skav213758  [mRNA]  locus=scaffold3859:38205:40900:+ [translate_table: standard]